MRTICFNDIGSKGDEEGCRWSENPTHRGDDREKNERASIQFKTIITIIECHCASLHIAKTSARSRAYGLLQRRHREPRPIALPPYPVVGLIVWANSQSEAR